MNIVLDYNYLIKVIVIGDSGVGKSSIIQNFTNPDRISIGKYIATVGIDFRLTNIIIDDKVVRMQIWDTAGQERFKTITQSYYRTAHSVIIVFDHTSIESFNSIETWIDNYRKMSMHDDDVVIFLFGNKIDLVEKQIITPDMISRIVDKYKIKYYGVSAISGVNINTGFMDLAKMTLLSGVADQPQTQINKYSLINIKQVELNTTGSAVSTNSTGIFNGCCLK